MGYPSEHLNNGEPRRRGGVSPLEGRSEVNKESEPMRKAILYLAGASVLGMVALAPGTTWAKSERDWGVTVGPGGVYVGPKHDHRYGDRDYRDRHRYDDEYAYRHRYDDEDLRYRRDRDRDY
jgi:hypothetical protein